MKISIDKEADAIYISLTDARVSESEEVAPGVIVDYDKKGEVVAIEILKRTIPEQVRGSGSTPDFSPQ